MKKNKILILLLLLFTFFVGLSVLNAPVIASTEYYSSISNTATGNELKTSLRNLITDTHTYKSSYEDCKDPEIVRQTDGDPNDSGNIILFWSGLSIDAAWDGGTSWNREHVWPQSQSGGLYGTSGAGSDLHHIRPVDASVNSSHNNNPYGIVSGNYYVTTSSVNGSVVTDNKCKGGLFEPTDSKKGDTARIIFYLMIRYESLEGIVDNVATSLDLLLEWNNNDPVDSTEIRRNNAVADIQGNRNPFIDNNNYANLIWDEENATPGGPNVTPEVNYYPVTVEKNDNECDVIIEGTKNENNYYTGDVSITVTPKEGYTYLGLKDINTNSYVTTSTSYTITNINQAYYLQAVFSNTENASYALVKDINNLYIGDNIIIVAHNQNVALSTKQNNNNRGEVDIEKVNEVISNVDGLQNIILEEGNIKGTFAFNVGGYLYAASSTANYLRTENAITNNSSWSISIDLAGVATIKSEGEFSRNILRYNSTSFLFGCYSNGQQDVSIYEKIQAKEDSIEVKTLKEFQKLSTHTSLLLNYDYENLSTEGYYTYTFANRQFAANGTKTLNGINWTLDCNGGYFGSDSTKGQQIGSGALPASYATLTSDSLKNIKSIKVNVSGGSGTNGQLVVKVGGNQVGEPIDLTDVATTYIIKDLDVNGEIQLSFTQTTSKALYIKSIDIQYGVDTTSYTLNTTSIRFGSYFSKEIYDILNPYGAVWGVEYAKGEITDWSTADIREVICNPARVSAPNSNELDDQGDYYQFGVVIKGVQMKDLNTRLSARVFVEINGQRYYMNAATNSVQDVAKAYLDLQETSEFSEHLGVLSYISNYEG